MTSGPAGSPTSRYVRSRPSRVDTAPPATSRPSSSAIVTNLPLACTVDSYLKTAVALVLQHCACLDRKIRRAGNASDDLRGTCCVGEHNAQKRENNRLCGLCAQARHGRLLAHTLGRKQVHTELVRHKKGQRSEERRVGKE